MSKPNWKGARTKFYFPIYFFAFGTKSEQDNIYALYIYYDDMIY